MLETYGSDAFPKRVPRQGVVDIVHALDIRPARDTKQAEVDMTQEDDDESADSKDSGSSPRYTSGGEEDQANTPVLSAPQMKSDTVPDGIVDAF